MDDQGLSHFQKVPPEAITEEDRFWLHPQECLSKLEFKYMMQGVLDGSWTLWRLLAPSEGVGVTYPEEGRLFVHYLHGKGIFGRLTTEDFLGLARSEGLSGLRCWAETRRPGLLRIYQRIGYKILGSAPLEGNVIMELSDER